MSARNGRCAASTPLAACLLVLVVAAVPCGAHNEKAAPAIARLTDWVEAEGGLLNGFAIAQDCPSCLRGVSASKDLEEGDVILKIPFKAVLQLKEYDRTTFAAEHARDVLDWMHNDPSFNATWGPFWSTLPGPDELLTPEVFTDDLLTMLQTPDLEGVLRHQRKITEQVYHGTYPDVDYAPFTETVPESKVNLDIFKWMSSLLSSRWWESKELGSHLVPMMDCVNHSDEPNALRSEEDGFVVLKATEPIQAGEAITINYLQHFIHRPDMSLALYGFVIEREEPLLCSVDLPTFNPEEPLLPTPLDDSIYDDEDSGYVTWDEYNRLSKRLAALGSSWQDDQDMLDSGMVAGWREVGVLQYRVLRKQALEQTLSKIAAWLEEDTSISTAGDEPALDDEDEWEFEQGQDQQEDEPRQHEELGFPTSYWLMAATGGVNTLAAVLLAVVIGRLAGVVREVGQAAVSVNTRAAALAAQPASAGKASKGGVKITAVADCRVCHSTEANENEVHVEPPTSCQPL